MKKILGLFIIVLTGLTLVSCTKQVDEPKVLNCIDGYVQVGDTCEVDTSDNNDDDDDTLYCELNDDDCIEEVESKLASMNLIQKAAQMVQAERGNITPAQVTQYGIGSILSGGGSHPSSSTDDIDAWYNMYKSYQDAALLSESEIPLIYGIDAVHGNNNQWGATIFPHNIGLGAANDAQLVYEVSQATAEEMLTTGINWTFAPALSVVQDIRWGRTYEGFSENNEIHMNLTYNAILGFEENGVSATAKHYFGDGGTIGGTDQGNVVLTEAEIRAIHLIPYYEAIRADVDTIMISYSSINGLKMHGSDYWINDVLKEEMGFEGFIISDWNAIHQLPGDFDDQVVDSINAGIDMLMEPYDWEQVIQIIFDNTLNGRIEESRIDDAVRRILTVKYERGLFENPTFKLDASYLNNEDHIEIAQEAVRKSLVLLENDNNSLPLSKDTKIFITGDATDNIGLMCGGWTTSWQGTTNQNLGTGTSIKEAVTNVLGSSTGSITNTWQEADTVIVVLSEDPYAEGAGDNQSLTLTTATASAGNQAALQLAADAKAAGKNVVGILLSGRPLLLENYLDNFDSFIAAWLPGTEGGTGIAQVIFGDYDFTGKLSFTWPANSSQFAYTVNEEDYDENSVLYPYGYGLTYND